MKFVETQHTNLLSKAMDAYTLRQKAIASNVANVDTPGYKRLEVKFEENLQKQMKFSLIDKDYSGVNASIEATEETPLLEDEMMTLADTQIRVQLATRSLRHSFELLQTGITGRTR